MPAIYTDTIYDILQRANPDVDLTSLTGVHDAAKSSLFNDDMLSLLDEQYRDIFVTAFALHYMQDEIGLPTFYAWKVALFEKMVTSSAWLNLLFENLDKQVFSNYSVSHTEGANTDKVSTIGNILKVTNETSKGDTTRTGSIKTADETTGSTSSTANNGATTTSGKTSDTAKETTSANTSNTETTNLTTEDDKTNTETTETTVTDDKTNTETTDTTKTGKSTNTETDNISNKETGTQKTANSGTDKTGHQSNRTETSTPSGTQTTEYSAVNTSRNYGAADTSGTSHFSDTPQSYLSDVANGTYLTNATYTTGHAGDHSDSENVGAHTEKVTGGIGSTKTIKSDASGTYDSTTYGKSETRTDDLTKTKTGTVKNDGSTTDTTEGTVTTTQTGTETTAGTVTDKQTGTETTKGTVTDSGTSSSTGNTEANGTSESTTTQTKDATASGTATTTGEGSTTYDNLKDASNATTDGKETTDTTNTKTGEGTDTHDSYSYSLNMEAFMRAEPFMNRMWHVFDDLFMCVYNTYGYPFNIFDI